MAETKLTPCRICNGHFAQSKLLDLHGIESQIENLIGVQLIKGVDIPTFICNQCNTDFEGAQEFRRKCIESNEFYESKCESLLKCDVVIPKEEQIEHIPLSPAPLSEGSFCREDVDQIHNDEDDFDENDHDQDPDYSLPPDNDKDNEKDEQDEKPNKTSAKSKKDENKSGKRVKKKSPKTKGRDLMNRKQKEHHALVCDICGNVFKARHIFALHKRRHSNDKPYVCELCPSKFFTNSELKRHMRRHTGEKPYECQFCHRKFSDYGTHVKHERTHTNDRPFACQHCGKAFSCGFVLKNHMLTHTGERNYKCTICNKSFGRQHNLTTHEKSIYHQNNLLKKENGDKEDS
ncbi:transcription factor Ouib-like [Episyrphus balteatus]|uniref:transcription factor Ouib-like n=1 Tax=Episyrphus balteatus TaxID=286459 RepID=UPI0024869C88|nr:transcription factor Ouib-like [Episyrphus balteatus]